MRGTLTGLVLGGCLALRCLAPAEAWAGGGEAPAIRLECRLPQAAELTPQALCEALEQSLAQLAPGLRTGGGDDAPLLVAVVTQAGRGGLTGHLLWQAGTGDAPEQGPEVRFQVMDASLSGPRLRGFTDALLKSAPRPLADLLEPPR